MLALLRNLDRRWIFLMMFLAVAIPILIQPTLSEKPTLYVQRVFDKVEKLPSDSAVLIAVDYDPATKGELAPMATAFIRHCCLKKHRMYFLTLWETAPAVVEQHIQEIIETEFADEKFKYGEDYINLGYSPGREIVIKSIGLNFRNSFAQDKREGKSLDEIPMTAHVTNLRDMDLIFDLSAGYPGIKEWVQYASSPYGVPLAAGTTAVQAPQMYPYFPEQLFGLLAAIKGAAEYEAALAKKYKQYDKPGMNDGIRRMAPQLSGHLLIIGLIVLGNVIYFAERRRGKRR